MAASCSSDRNLGVPGVMHELADRWREEGHEVRMRFRDRPGRLGEVLFGWNLARCADARWADVVDSHAVEAWPLAGRKGGPVVVARSHGLELSGHRRMIANRVRQSSVYWAYRGSVRLLAERRAIRSADASLILNESDLAVCRDEFGADPARLHLVRNGFPPAFLAGSLEPRPPSGIAFVGSWLERKGNDLAIEAIVGALRQFPSTPVLVAGTGASREEVLSGFPDDVRDRIEVLSRFRREDLSDLLGRSSILLFPSRAEGYPLALVEAMALGLAPVATAIPGVVEVVDPSSGVLVPSGDADALREALVGLLADPDRVLALRRGARERVRNQSWDGIAAQQMDIFRDALRRRGRSAE
jgi:glycosyltransferase involved in cell wall biosynthesis